jgi:hypothetical protein
MSDAGREAISQGISRDDDDDWSADDSSRLDGRQGREDEEL